MSPVDAHNARQTAPRSSESPALEHPPPDKSSPSSSSPSSRNSAEVREVPQPPPTAIKAWRGRQPTLHNDNNVKQGLEADDARSSSTMTITQGSSHGAAAFEEIDARPERRRIERPDWWFDGTSHRHADYLIDLHGDTTDHLPDVRAYLLLVYERSRRVNGGTEPPYPKPTKPSLYVADHTLLENERIKIAKTSLLRAWRKGRGFFLDPKKKGRDLGALRRADGRKWSLPWLSAMQAERDPEYRWDDRALRNDPASDEDTEPDWEADLHCTCDESMIRTNIRSPLPRWEHVRVDDQSNWWIAFIYAMYSYSYHPASQATEAPRPAPAERMADLAYQWVGWYIVDNWWLGFYENPDDDD